MPTYFPDGQRHNYNGINPAKHNPCRLQFSLQLIWLPLVREIQGQGKVREFCTGSGTFEILRSQGNTGKSLESQGNLTFSCHTRDAAMPQTRIHYA